MRKGQKTQNKLEFRLKNKENRQKAGLKSCFFGVDRDKTGRIGFFGSSGGTSGFGLQIGTVPTKSRRLASMPILTTSSTPTLNISWRNTTSLPDSPTRVAAPSENLPDDRQTPRADARARPVPPLESANVLLWYTKQLAGSAACSTSAWRNANYMTVPANMWPPLGSVLVPPPKESTIALNIRCRRMPTTRIANHQSRSRCCLNTAIYCTSISRKQRRSSRWNRLSIAGTNPWEPGFLVWSLCPRIFQEKKEKIRSLYTIPFLHILFINNHMYTHAPHARTSHGKLPTKLGPVSFSQPYLVHDKPFFFSSLLRQDPLEAILVIFGRWALICFLFESSWKKMKNDTTFVRMRSDDHLGDAKMSKKGTSFRRI